MSNTLDHGTPDEGVSHGIVLGEWDHPCSRDSVLAAAFAVGAHPAHAAAAADNIAAHRVRGLLLSGRQGAGKDTVAPLALAKAGVTDAVQCRVSDAIKAEMTSIIATLSSQDDTATAAAMVAELVDLRLDHADVIVSLLWDVTRAPNHELTGFSRTPEIRRALQYHGHEARIETHPGYWINACYQRVVPLLAKGQDVFLTDGRFPGEVDTARALGLYTARLYVDPVVQHQRIMGRDGIEPDPESINHPGERLLDDYEGFHLKLDNSGALEPVVSVLASRFANHRC